MNGVPQTQYTSPQTHRMRLPTVDEALQFSPLTSIVPFSSDVLPLPIAIPSSQTSGLFSYEDKALADRTLSYLDAHVSHSQDQASAVHETLRLLQHDYLHKSNLTKLKFKVPPPVQQSPPDSHYYRQPRASFADRLKPFCKLVLDTTDIPYRYATATPSRRESSVNGNHNKRTQDKQNTTPTSTGFREKDQQSHSQPQNATPFHQSSSAHTPHSVPAVVIPGLPPSSAPSQYVDFPELDAAIIRESPQGSKSKREAHVTRIPLLDNNQQPDANADAALLRLQELMFTVFEAEDQLEPDTSVEASRNTNNYFTTILGIEKSFLANTMYTQLEQALADVSDVHFKDISADSLSRLQKMCSIPLAAITNSNLSIPADGGEDSLEQYARNLQLADNGFRAIRVLLRIASAERDEKQLFSEETLQELLESLKHVVETCLVPVVEQRSASSQSRFLKSKPELVKTLSALLQRAGKVLKLLGDLVLKQDLSETTIASVQFLVTQLVFVENAPSEKDSLLGIQKFETARRHAMDLIAKISVRYPEQRSFIFDEILTSLEKLPVTRQNARQFKLMDGKPIQLVSALIMVLVQTSAIKAIQDKARTVDDDDVAEEHETESVTSESSTDSQQPYPRRRIAPVVPRASEGGTDPLTALTAVAKPLIDMAQHNSSYVAKYLVQRALKSSKSSDQPFRNLLDIFTEDLINVLGSPDWPAAELLLRAILTNLITIADNDKSTAPAKCMALEIIGVMGSGIADLQAYLNRTSQIAENSATSFSKQIARLCIDSSREIGVDFALCQVDGPCRAVIEYYQENKSDELQNQSARSYFLAYWARCVASVSESAFQEKDSAGEEELSKQTATSATWLKDAIMHPDSIIADPLLDGLTATNTRLSYALSVLNTPFCKAFRRMINILLTASTSPHATVRSRSFKALVQLLEKDPSILERYSTIFRQISKSASDPSSLVRDSALTLLGKCMDLRQSLEPEVCNAIITMTTDPAVLVRKRAIKLLKDLYLRNKSKDVRASVADALLHVVNDVEDSVAEVARQAIEEIWFTPFQHIHDGSELSIQTKQDLQRHAFHIVSLIQRDDSVLPVLESLLKASFSHTTKTSQANIVVSTHLVSLLFDNIIDNDLSASDYSQQDILQTLTIFAKSYPRLFTAEQMITLKPYTENLKAIEDLLVFRCVIVIYRFVLPVLPPLQHDFLQGVQNILFTNIQKLPKNELLESAACISIIDSVLKNTQRLVGMMISVLGGIHDAKSKSIPDDPHAYKNVRKYMQIAGCFGKTCNLDDFLDRFKQKFPTWKGESVPELIVDMIAPLATAKNPLAVRESALDSICLTCQAAPKNFLKPHVTAAFTSAFQEREPRLEIIVLAGIKEFYETEEERSKSGSVVAVGAGAVKGAERLGKSMVLSDNDGATTSIAQHYLSHILRIALDSTDNLALTATEVIASTNRQGLVHPKETGSALVALGTSPNAQISSIALTEHRNLHGKHESMLEKEYVSAIEQAFAYQRDTIQDISGVDAQKLPKLRQFYDVLKSGSLTLRKKLLGNLCSKLDHDLAKSKKNVYSVSHVQFARFVLENLSLLDYERIDELLHLLAFMEKIFAKTGNELAQRMESTLHLEVGTKPEGDERVILGVSLQDPQQVDPVILRQLTACAMTLSIFWETRSHLRRLWSLQSLHDGRAKAAAKDVSKAPTKSPSVSAERHLDKIAEIMDSLSSQEKMMHRCKMFIELLSIDNELKVASDQEDAEALRLRTPSEEATNGDGTPKAVNGKRKGSVSAKSTPSKPRKRGRPSMTPRKRSRSYEEEGEDDWN